MVIRGRSRSNGAQLADYLLNSRENDHARIIDIRGTAQPDNLKKSLLEMSLSSELTKTGDKGIYHAQVNPAIGEDRPMTQDDWLKAADMLEESLGFAGQKRAIVLHEKNGRLHGHIVWERYDHDTGILRSDSHNFKKHDQARAEIEQALGHERTAQKADRVQEPTHKDRLTQLWQDSPDGRSFIDAAGRAGYYIAQRDDRRPFRAITPEGDSVDLVRQLDGIKTKDVRDRLQPIRADLWPEADALQRVRHDRNRVQSEPKQSEILHKMSEIQDLFNAMINEYKYGSEIGVLPVESGVSPVEVWSYGFSFSQPPALPHEPDANKTPSENLREISDSQDIAAAMLEQYQQRQIEQQRKEQEAKEQLQAANDNKSEIEKLKEQQRQARERGRSRGGYSR